jgi:hypothetical protein
MNSPQSLEDFYPALAGESEVKSALKTRYGKDAAAILEHLASGRPLGPELAGVEDTLADLVDNDAFELSTFYANGSDGHFPIEIMNFGPVYFVRATEFDDIGFFGSEAEAVSFAKTEYEAYGPFSDSAEDEDEDW